MSNWLNIVLLIINIITFIIALLFVGVFGLYEYFTGAKGLEKLLQKMEIPLTYNQVFAISIVSTALTIILYILRTEIL